VGGEWAGSALLSAEYAPGGRRGLYGMFTLLGGGVAGVMSSLTFLGVNVTIGEYSPEFLQWGWRVPFLISGVLIALALYVRLNIDETPVFAEEKARDLVPKAPLAEVFRLQGREIFLAAGSVLGSMGVSATWATPISRCTPTRTWAIRVASSGRSACSVVWSASRPWWSRPVCAIASAAAGIMLVGWAACVPWAFVVLPLIDTGKPALYAVAIVGTFAISGIGSGPTGAFIPELFATRYRYSGSAMSINLAGVNRWGPAGPLIAGTLLATYGSWSIGVMLAAPRR